MSATPPEPDPAVDAILREPACITTPAGKLAFTAFVARYEGMLRRVARQRLSREVRKGVGSEDIVNSVYARCLEMLAHAPGEFGSERDLLAWVLAVLRNRVTDFQRKRVATGFDSVGPDPIDPAGVASSPPELAEAAEREQGLKDFRAAVEAALPPYDWFLFKRRYLDGLSLAEVGAEIGLSEDGVRMKMKRLAARLREKLPHFADRLVPDAE